MKYIDPNTNFCKSKASSLYTKAAGHPEKLWNKRKCGPEYKWGTSFDCESYCVQEMRDAKLKEKKEKEEEARKRAAAKKETAEKETAEKEKDEKEDDEKEKAAMQYEMLYSPTDGNRFVRYNPYTTQYR